MERSISWDWVYEHLESSCEKMDDAIVDELHELFLTKKRRPFSLRGRCMYREIVSEDEYEYSYGLPEKPERTFTLGEIVDAAAKRLSLDAGMVIQNVLYALLGEDGTKEERKKVDSISARIIRREERAYAKQEIKGHFDFTTKKENNMDENNTPQGTNITNNFEGAHIEKIVYNYGTINENNYGQGKSPTIDTESAVLKLLDELVQDAIRQEKSPKYILLPVRAAKDADMLPMANLDWVNERYGLKLSNVNYSDWVSKENANYDNRELPPLVERFRALKPSKM